MPEEELETTELKETIDQRLEDHEHAGHGGHGGHAAAQPSPSWLRYLSLSTAIIAVFAAVASLESGANSNEAILEKSDAMLHQSQASDQWAYYQAKGIKATISEGIASSIKAISDSLASQAKIASEPAPAAPGDAKPAGASGAAADIAAERAKLDDAGRRYRREAEAIKKDAETLDDRVKEDNERSDARMEHHHRFALAVTLLQIAIALSAIGALTRRKPLWFLSMVVSVGGVVMFVWGLL
jgi:hypothetical protein